MIFVTVGSMLPFDRLVQRMDEWAAQHPEFDVYAQIGTGRYIPRSMRWKRALDRAEFAECIDVAECVVSHAGIGTIFTALEHRRPIVILPRRSAWGEHTNDHQLHTAKWLLEKPGINVAMTDDDLGRILADPPTIENLANHRFSLTAPPEFIAKIRCFLEECRSASVDESTHPNISR